MPRRNSNVELYKKLRDTKQVEPRDQFGGDILRLYIELDVPVPRGAGWSTFDWNNHYARNKRKPKRNRGGGYRGR